jgi:hypothetical protein
VDLGLRDPSLSTANVPTFNVATCRLGEPPSLGKERLRK